MPSPASPSPARPGAVLPGAARAVFATVARAALVGALPGLLAGTHLVALIYFLNPDLPLTLPGLVRAVAFYGGLLALATALAAVPFALRRPRQVARALPWALTAVLALGAATYAYHASRFAFYLPDGVNLRLLKAAGLLGFGALISFYTTLLHSVMRRGYGWRSRWGLAALAVATVYAAVERREAFARQQDPHPRVAAVLPAEPLRLLVVGLDGASLEAVLPLARRGDLPFLASVLEAGAYGRLRTLAPNWPGAVWTTLATGIYPFRHGVRAPALYPLRGFPRPVSLLPTGFGIDRWALSAPPQSPPAPAESTLAMWQVLERMGLRCSVGAWPGPHPAVTGDSDAGFAGVRSALAAGEADAAFTVLPELAALSRQTFGGFLAVVRGSSRPADVAAAAELTAGYVAVDHRLAELADAAGRSSTILAVVSAYGTLAARGGVLRRTTVEGTTEAAADGLFLLTGPGVAAGRPLGEIRLVDVAPTLLYALGLPIARDLDGRIATAAFTDELLGARGITFVPSYGALAPIRPLSP